MRDLPWLRRILVIVGVLVVLYIVVREASYASCLGGGSDRSSAGQRLVCENTRPFWR